MTAGDTMTGTGMDGIVNIQTSGMTEDAGKAGTTQGAGCPEPIEAAAMW